MPLQTSGAISLDDIEDEFGGSAPTSLSEYYAVATGIPSSGEISIEDFYGKAKPVTLTSGTNVQQALASDYISDGGTLTIPSNTYIWSDNTSTAALIVDVDNATIINNGYIIGKGGAGATISTYAVAAAGSPGGPAIKVTGSNCSITNNSGAYIAGGGGGGGGGRMAGGGGGAGGGAGGNGIGYGSGGGTSQTGGIGGLPGQSGTGGGTTSGTAPAVETGTPSNAVNWGGSDGGSGDRGGHGGGSGGGGATGIDTGSSNGLHGGGGGGGGRILPGTGGNGGNRSGNSRPSGREGGDGGSSNNVGDFGLGSYGGEDGAGGGGGWGAAGGAGALSSNGNGGAGGAGGKAIEVASGGSAIVTNNGTIYGTDEGASASTLTSSALVNGEDNRKQITASTFISAGEALIIPSDMWVWSDSTSTAALTIDISCTIINYGKIIGRGGNGGNHTGTTSGGAGGPAIKINSSVSGVTIQNKAGAYIAGGGGGGGYVNNGANDAGGGGGAGGGRGGDSSHDGQAAGGTAGGTLNAKGANGAGHNSGNLAFGGEAGGSGGLSDESSGGNGYGTRGGGGGRILPGTQTATWTAGRSGLRALGKGGGGGQAGTSGGTSGNGAAGHGGGGWGAAGGGSNGGAAGKAVEDSGNSYTLTNNGTIYGATT